MTLLPVADGARLLGIHRHSPAPLAQRGQYAPGDPPDGCTYHMCDGGTPAISIFPLSPVISYSIQD